MRLDADVSRSPYRFAFFSRASLAYFVAVVEVDFAGYSSLAQVGRQFEGRAYALWAGVENGDQRPAAGEHRLYHAEVFDYVNYALHTERAAGGGQIAA